MPLWLGADEVGLTFLIEQLETNPSGDTLMMTAFLLVMLNTVRALPHYLGALLLGDELGYRLQRPWLKIIVPIVIIPLVYAIINVYNPLDYYFGGPALLLVTSIVVLQRIAKGRLRPIIKSFLFSQLLFGIQWLDTVIFLTPFSFGGGPISTKVKDIAVSLGFETTLSFYSLVLCSIFVGNAIVLAIYLTVSEQKWTMSQDLNIARGEMIESRSGREAMHLVHDLKTPLALIEGLNSLIQMKTTDKEIHDYTEKISDSIQSTSNMVSEILYDERKNWCTLKRLIEYVRANKLSYAAITFDFQLYAQEDTEIYINKIRMTRALINLIDNACDTVDGHPDAYVAIHTKEEENGVYLGVADNGKGMTTKEEKHIWNPGYSTKSHPGVGLTFVKNVVEEHDATLHIDSQKGKGTTFWIQLPKESARFENSNH
ncbi:GHKL domain-containing protein [Pontibacillus yanchengensis]|uniref:histidine kinase n=2 Tax=Pontibacillus yanchengensis TaxID=462910 RepID=A0A6I5A7C1_9BACI|nr:GHKL domain-containing protein [Pontibacillus yanchengensis]